MNFCFLVVCMFISNVLFVENSVYVVFGVMLFV